MDKPLRTGFAFGAGFSLVFVLIMLFVYVASHYLQNRQLKAHVESLKTFSAMHSSPTVLRVEPALRGGQLTMLVTVRNDEASTSVFAAEVVMYGPGGLYYDTCPGGRSYSLEPGRELSFRADCPDYGIDEAQTIETLERTDVQFHQPDR